MDPVAPFSAVCAPVEGVFVLADLADVDFERVERDLPLELDFGVPVALALLPEAVLEVARFELVFLAEALPVDVALLEAVFADDFDVPALILLPALALDVEVLLEVLDFVRPPEALLSPDDRAVADDPGLALVLLLDAVGPVRFLAVDRLAVALPLEALLVVGAVGALAAASAASSTADGLLGSV